MKSLFFALSAAALISGAAFATEIERHTNVTFEDLNLASKDGVVALHTRLLAAADQVCADTKETKRPPFYEECRQKAVQQAIAAVGSNLAKRLATIQ